MALVFTDGMDTESFLSPETVRELAGRSPIALFSVAEGTVRSVPIDFFNALADATGGLAQLVPPYTILTQRPTGFSIQAVPPPLLDDAFIAAFDDFRSSYVVRYALGDVARDGWHDVTVRVTRPNGVYETRTRRRYFVEQAGLERFSRSSRRTSVSRDGGRLTTEFNEEGNIEQLERAIGADDLTGVRELMTRHPELHRAPIGTAGTAR